MNKEKLKIKIDEMERSLQKMKSELNNINRFEFKYDTYKIFIGTTNLSTTKLVNNKFSKCGRFRKTIETANNALQLQTRVMRLHALVEQLNGFGGEYYIMKTNDEWSYQHIFNNMYFPETILMTENCAIEICRLLNNGEFKL